MGNTLGGEYLSTWDQDDVKKWKEKAAQSQKFYYLQFDGSQFHDVSDLSESLRIIKICFALFGPPQEEKDKIEDAYTNEQRETAAKIYKTIHEVWLKAPEKQFMVGFRFIFCKEGDKEFPVPIFSLLWQKVNHSHHMRYIDTMCRVYENWEDWKTQNRLPMLKYCFPKYGFYSCSENNQFDFDPEKDPALQFGATPACDLSARIGRIFDVTITTVGIGVGLVSLFTPAGFISGPILLGTTGTSAVYGLGRAGQRLVDKYNHNESLTDLESIVLMLSILAAPLHFVTALANARLAAGAAQGRIFTQSQRLLATSLMITSLSIDSFFFLMNVVNLVEKALKKELTALDLLQFSISTLFFTNTLMQPKTAAGVINKFQEQRIGEIANQMTDAQAKQSFQKFVDANKGEGGIQAKSKIVRTLNRMEDPSCFFSKTQGFDMKIGGRKGRTVLLTDGKGYTQRTNPNHRTDFAVKDVQGLAKISKRNQLKICLGNDHEAHKYLKNMSPRDQARVNNVFEGAAGYDRDTVRIAERLAEQLGIPETEPGKFMSLVEVVAAERKSGRRLNFNDPSTFSRFLNDINIDLKKIGNIVARKQLKFVDDYLALYHYRKHGEEFMTHCSLQFYLGELPSKVVNQGKLVDVCEMNMMAQNGVQEVIHQKTYYLPNDEMCVVREGTGKTTISTVYKNQAGYEKYQQRIQVTKTPPLDVALERIGQLLGLDGLNLQISHSRSTFDQNTFATTNALKEDSDYCRWMMSIFLSDYTDYLEDTNNDKSGE